MSWSKRFTSEQNINQPDISSGEIQTSTRTRANEESNENDRVMAKNDPFLSNLIRVCVSWRQTLSSGICLLLSLVFFIALNMKKRIASFQAASPLSSVLNTSTNQTNGEDISHPSTSLLDFDSLSSENSTMAHVLVQQQTSSNQTDTLVPSGHEVNKGLLFSKQDSADLLHFLQTFSNEQQRSMYDTTAKTFLDTNSLPSLNESNHEEEKLHNFNENLLEPTIKEDKISDTLNSILSSGISDELNGDSILDSNSPLNAERHFRRRKRRTSLTRTSLSNDENELTKTDSIEQTNSNQEDGVEDLNETLERISLNEKKEDHSVKNEELNDKTDSPGRFRARKFRCRSPYQQTPSVSQESTSDSQVQFFVPNEIPNSSLLPTPPSSPTSLVANASISSDSQNTSTGALKRSSSSGIIKKMVRFADSVGRQLAQVQYIRSLTDDDSKNFSFLKNSMYVPKSLNIEHKPWAFDVEIASKQTSEIRVPKRFFCLFRQPNSEHPEIYLHEVWKSQIKLEYANIRFKSSLTGEQFLYGTLWVTNAGYHKNVTIQYTFNRWLNKYEYEATHLYHSNDIRNLDKFEFNIDIPHDIDRVDFVLRYRVNGQEHWDNNEGKNYTLETESAYTPKTTISLPHDCSFNEMRFY
ncbi:unnamed protein product [Rotaria magnacalcarata]|uniref:CBM21 domain-containing protein n=1 Tax=Rotaria magnacalcarata TaxID=392030 RepID=A0A816PX96_9BILA|nr:unnamed protein product [Rotaria magnacalcarata]CAF4036567.1 unnamed protein product [Rotaria magnacalcarata]